MFVLLTRLQVLLAAPPLPKEIAAPKPLLPRNSEATTENESQDVKNPSCGLRHEPTVPSQSGAVLFSWGVDMMCFQHGSQGPATSQVSCLGVKAVHSLGSLLGLEKQVKGRKEKRGSSHELLTGGACSPGRTAVLVAHGTQLNVPSSVSHSGPFSNPVRCSG